MIRFAPFAMLAVLAACAPQPKPLSAAETEIHNGFVAMATATAVSRFCPTLQPNVESMIDITRRYVDMQKSGAVDMQNYKANEAARRRAASNAFRDFVARYGIDESKPETVCAAGRAEIQARTMVGRFLLPV